MVVVVVWGGDDNDETSQCITLEGWTDMLYWVHDAQGNLGMASEFF